MYQQCLLFVLFAGIRLLTDHGPQIHGINPLRSIPDIINGLLEAR